MGEVFDDEYYRDLVESVRGDVHYETSEVKVVIIADDLNQARRYAKSRRLKDSEWKFVVGKCTLISYPLAEVACIADELYREDLLPILDYTVDSGRNINYE